MKKLILLIFLFLIFSCKKEEEKRDIINQKDGDWIILNDKNKIPEQIKDFFVASEKDELKIANPNEEFNVTDVVLKPNLPIRQLRLLEKKNEIWRMVYIQGGIGKSYQFYEFKIQGDTISQIKKGYSFKNIETNDSLEYYINKGNIKFEKIKIKYRNLD
ncbi:hypothetical protein [Epilithonimonas sp.]|uniref:hypothetical protein n=1 Tax=Epilithonimonas sp. TaxID=2894511 RepID=UPI0028A295DB|nr:hypothetical protein [Epilithonimonas sp.]